MKYCPICERTYGDEAAVCDVDGSILRDSTPTQDSFIGKTIKGRYRVLQKLGEGGMSVVYLAEQINIERRVALKVLHGEYARDAAFVRRFRQEAKLAASLNHRNVIQVYDFDQGEDGNLFIAMEYLLGKNLKEVIQEGTLGIPRAVHLGIQIADGLGAAHRAGVIHRDIKPENIMVVGGGGEVKLMDFGIARLREVGASTRLTRAGMIMGTPAYMAPEQIEGKEINERTDIYGFGIVLYEMLSNVVPFTAPTPAAVMMKHLNETPVALRKRRREIPAPLERVVAQALEKKPERRPANMAEIAETLRKLEREFARETQPETLVATQPLDVTFFRDTQRQRGVRGLLKRIRGEPRVRKDFQAVEGLEEAASQERDTAASGRQYGDQARSDQHTVLETMAVTQPIEIKRRRLSWKWITVSGAALLLAFVAVKLGMVVYNQVPDLEGDRIAEVGKQETKSPGSGRVLTVAIAADKGELTLRERLAVRLSARFSDGTIEEIKEGVEWASSDPSVLITNAKGEVEARGVGKAQVTARYKGVEALAFPIVVTEPPALPPISEPRLVSLSIQGAEREVNVAGRLSFLARAKYSDGQQRVIKKGVRWESSDRTIATINPKGEVEGRSAGKAQIIARYQDIASEPFGLMVRAPLLKRTEPAPGDKKPPVVKEPYIKEPDTKEYIKAARTYRDRGEYSQAFVELEKARKVDPSNKEVQAEISITKQACTAEKNLGRPDLRC